MMKKIIVVSVLLSALSLMAANPTFQSFNADQFGSAGTPLNISVKSSALLTNTVFYAGDTGAGAALIEDRRLMSIDGNSTTVSWGVGGLNTGAGDLSVNWFDRVLYASDGNFSLNWQDRVLYSSDGGVSSLDWGLWRLYDAGGNTSIDWGTRQLWATDVQLCLQWGSEGPTQQYVSIPNELRVTHGIQVNGFIHLVGGTGENSVADDDFELEDQAGSDVWNFKGHEATKNADTVLRWGDLSSSGFTKDFTVGANGVTLGGAVVLAVATTNVSPQTASVSPTAVYRTPDSVTDYDVSGQIYVTTPTGAGTVSLSLIWADQIGLRTNTSANVSLANLTNAASIVSFSVPLMTCTNSSDIKWATTVTSGGGAAYFTRINVKRIR